MRFGYIYFSLIAILNYGCKCDPDLVTLKEIPEIHDLVGKWYPDNKTLKEKSGFSDNPNAYIELKADSICIIKNFPLAALCDNHDNAHNSEPINTEGNWDYSFSNKNDFTINIYGGYTRQNGDYHSMNNSWKLLEKKGQLYIWFRVGDPDYCRTTRLFKKDN